MKFSNGILFFILFCRLVCSHNIVIGQEISNDQKNFDRHTFLVSFGGSGNTWLRYCLEFLTKRPTLKYRTSYKNVDKILLDTTTKHMKLPINNTIPLGVDYSKPPIFKVHQFRLVSPLEKVNRKSNAIFILLLRNPKECVLRNSSCNFQKAAAHLGNPNFSFYQNLKIFNKWNPKTRKIVYYEDLIERPEKTLKELLDFLGEDDQHLSEFMQNYAFHKEQSLEFYKFTNHASKSKGASAIFYSTKLSSEERTALDDVIKSTQPLLWDKYLIRYAEK